MPQVSLYSAKLCPYAHRVRLVLQEKGVDFDLIEIDLQNKPDWFADISPQGQVPVLQHEHNRLWESSIINEYLDEVFPEPPLMPKDPGLRAIARIWINFADTQFMPACHSLLLSQDIQQQEYWRDKLQRHLLFIDQEGLRQVSKTHHYWLGNFLSLVDLSFYPTFEQWAVLEQYRGAELPAECTQLREWLSTIRQSPPIKAIALTADAYVQEYARYFSN
jgi:glutathione S-transferase